jgi:MFS family permease
VLINFLNYTDRAILPGSANEFVTFISFSLKTDKPDVYFGVLQSSFIIGFSIASVLISRLVHFHGAFYLCSMGLMMWILAALLSGAGFFLKSFSLLLLGRMLSGIGEASFVCIVPPWIVKHAPSGQQGKWLAIFYTAIAVGTAFGYAYAAFVANNLGCHFSFVFESIAMIPLIIVLLKYAPYYPVSSSSLSHSNKEDSLTPSEAKLYATTEMNMNHAIDQSIDSKYELHTSPIISYPSLYPSNQDSAQVIEEQTPTSMLSELQAVLRSPIYLLITGGTRKIYFVEYYVIECLQLHSI